MIQWNIVTWYSQVLAIVLGVVIFFGGFYVGSKEASITQEVPQVSDKVTDSWPTLQLPLEYFDYTNVRSGSAGGEYPNWQSASFNDGYRSFPTTTILFDDYSNEHVDFPVLPTAAEWESITAESVPFGDIYKKQGEDFGDLGKRFSFDIMDISFVKMADVTGDRVSEAIIALGDMGGNHQPYYYKIVQGDKIIFESGKGTEQLAGFEPDASGNGFTLSWRDSKHLTQGLCCALGSYSTRFVYKDGVFKPLYEQEELYYQVENSEFTSE